MITKEQVQSIITPKVDEEGLFIVEITVSTTNHITIFIDGDKGVTIDQCISISKFIEENLNRDEEDYELDVSSAGLDLPLKVARQYLKNIGRMVDIVTKKGQKFSGKLVDANNDSFKVEVEKTVLQEGKKRKEKITEVDSFNYSDIKSTKIVVSFR